MWSTVDVIEQLRNHRHVCAKIDILENLILDNKPIQKDTLHFEKELTALKTLRNQVNGWIKLLPREESFLVQTHLIDGLDWAKTIVEYEKMWGVVNGRSERTLKRIQSKAIDRIVHCLNQIDALPNANRI